MSDRSPTPTSAINGTRLSLADDGTLQNCGDCRNSQLFGFEVCENADRIGFDDLRNAATKFYGHILYTTDQADIKCLTATKPYNGSSLTATDCQYDYDNAGASGQYFEVSIGDTGGDTIVRLVSDEAGETYSPDPAIGTEGGKLTMWSGPPDAPFTYLGFQKRDI